MGRRSATRPSTKSSDCSRRRLGTRILFSLKRPLPDGRGPEELAEALPSRDRRPPHSALRTLRAEFILLNLDGDAALFETRDAAAGDQLQLASVVELGGPTDRELKPLSGQQDLVGSKQDAVAADVYGFASTLFLPAALAQNSVAHVAFDVESIGAPSIGATIRPSNGNIRSFQEQGASSL